MGIKIYHNPRCSKSRQALNFLQEKSVNFEVVEYLKNPFKEQELKSLIKILGISPAQLLRKNELAYKENNLSDESLTDEQIIQAILENPILIERPIVVFNSEKAIIARPPELVLDFI